MNFLRGVVVRILTDIDGIWATKGMLGVVRSPGDYDTSVIPYRSHERFPLTETGRAEGSSPHDCLYVCNDYLVAVRTDKPISKVFER